MDPQTELTRRYPLRDFSAVFAFLASVPLLGEGDPRTQVHHICPKKQYPQFRNLKLFPENGVVLSLADHVYVHLLLELCEPELKSPATAFFEMQNKAASNGGLSNVKNGTGFCAQGVAAEGGRKTYKAGTGIHAAGIAAKGGAASAAKRKENGTFIEHQTKSFACGLHTRWHVMRGKLKQECAFCLQEVFWQKTA